MLLGDGPAEHVGAPVRGSTEASAWKSITSDLANDPPSRLRPGTVARWSGLLIVALGLLSLPFLYAAYHFGLRPSQYRAAQIAIFGLLAVWLLGRPLAVLIVGLRPRPEPASGPVNGVSVVVPVHNAANKIEATLASLLAQTVRPIEIIFVENNSSDDTWDVLLRLEREHAEVRAFTIHHTKPGEYAASHAVNHGIARASHEIVVRMDDDTLMSPTTVAKALPWITSGKAVAVACNLRVANHGVSVWTRLQSMEYLLAMEMDRRAQVLVQSILCCSGGLAVFRRDVVIRAGGFCSLPRWVSEDIDMTLKSHRLGLVAMAPSAIGYTTVPESLRDLMKQRFRWAICGTVALYLHRNGLVNRGYWYEGKVGFLGLPMRGITAFRDLLAVVYPFYLALLIAHGGAKWLGILLLVQTAVLVLQAAMIAPVLRSRQGLRYVALAPIFTLLYGPLLLGVRFAGTWAGLRHVLALRRKEAGLEHAGLELATAELSPSRAAEAVA